MEIQWLSEREVRQLLSMSEAIAAVEEAFRQHGLRRVQMPPKLYLDFYKHGGDLRAMPAYLEEQDAAGVKIVNVHPDNPGKGLPTVMAVLVINDPSTGAPSAIMDGTYLTDVRTGAGGAVAVKYLARKDSRVVGMIGAGRQARTQLLAINEVLGIEEVRVAGKSKEGVIRFIEEMHTGVKADYVGCDLREACDCDILITTTPVRRPIVKAEWIREGTHINAIGADAEGKEELAPGVLKKAKIVVDDMAQAVHSGEVNVPLAEGVIAEEDIYGELGRVVAGKIAGREDSDEITIFDSTGLAIQDVATGVLVYEKALSRDLGTKLSLF
jgi:alanine dehydrogenase